MVLRFNVGGKVLDRADLIRKKKWPWRLDVLPFAVLYAIWMVTIVPSIDIVDALIVLGGLVSIHVLTLLFTAWSIDFKCFVQYSKLRRRSFLVLKKLCHCIFVNKLFFWGREK
ncbi:hypothetical protein OIU77_007070 [Salix suchowensis]|uniref:P5A-ATPase transmembrane helical hairpin domain-containing protein n=1 Tax=Salix suchowensis TaxID=1278906 RepID=A0ABQ9AMV5_9ROSI|nr:hypothetical protein OIU77_007070 [Salix suchowensis]